MGCWWVVLLLAAWMGGCAAPPDSEIPGYLRLEPPLVETRSADGRVVVSEGFARDVWLFQGGQYIGTFQPPVTVPLLNRDRTRYLARLGVWNTGDPQQRIIYPFWQFDTLDFAFRAEEETSWRPRARYFDDSTLAFPYREDFEGATIGLVYGEGIGTDTAFLLRETGSAFEGRQFGRVRFGERQRVFFMLSPRSFRLPRRMVWAEVSYRGNRKFGLGLLAQYGREEALIPAPPGFVPALPPDPDGWQRIYFDLTPIVTNTTEEATYRLYLNSIAEGSSFELDFDHLRIVHFR